MAGRLVRCLLVLAFAAAVGHVAWHALVGPPLPPEYFVEGDGRTLAGADPADKALYLRRLLFLSRRPRHAWLEVVGRDRLVLYVNGAKVAEKSRPGFPAALVADLAPYLKEGRNVLAIRAEQASVRRPPAVAVRGGYTQGGAEHPIGADGPWRSSPVPERGAGAWYAPEFNDAHWPPARVGTGRPRSVADGPPRATTEPDVGHWVGSHDPGAREAVVRRDFWVAGRPRQAWLRVTATAPYTLAVNGLVLDQPADDLISRKATPPVRRLYDITAATARGHNSVALLLTGRHTVPHVLADLEVEDGAGKRYRLGTAGDWLSRAGAPPGWSGRDLADGSGWLPPLVLAGDLDVPPWQPQRKTVAVSLPAGEAWRRVAGQLGLVAAVALLAWLACRLAGAWLARLRPEGTGAAAAVAYLPLLPAAVTLGGAVLASFDPRVARQDVYRGLWVWLALASLPLQWALLALAARRPAVRAGRPALGKIAAAGLLLVLVAVGFWLRFRDMTLEPMIPDEVLHYNCTRGLLERGYPSLQTRPDVPVKYVSTSELMFLSTGATALVTDDPVWIVRFPAVCFGTAVIVLTYLAGRRLFGRPAGLLAAAFYALSPACIALSNLGRYFEQTQFFTLLTVYFFWLALRGAGPLGRRYVWLTGLSYCAAFLSWEGAGLIAPGMIVAALVQRRGRLRTILYSGTVWTAMGVVLVVILLQMGHRQMERFHFLQAGLALGSETVAPMWRYPLFEPWYYLRGSSWTPDLLLPLVGLGLAVALAVRHPYRRPLRYLLLVYVVGCLLLAALVANKTWRYGHHLVPLFVLATSAGFLGCAGAVARFARRAPAPAAWRGYAAGVGLVPVLAVLGLGCGLTVQLLDMPKFRAFTAGVTTYKFPGMDGPVRHLKEHLRPGDVVIATHPHQLDFLMGRRGWAADYVLGTVLGGAVEFPDDAAVAVNAPSGTPVVNSPQDVADLFARHDRVWCVAVPANLAWRNTEKVSAYLREHMEVVYEDDNAVLLFWGGRHWQPAGRENPYPHAEAAP
jgi:hypothetical protein